LSTIDSGVLGIAPGQAPSRGKAAGSSEKGDFAATVASFHPKEGEEGRRGGRISISGNGQGEHEAEPMNGVRAKASHRDVSALAEALLAQAAEAKVDEKKVEQASLSPDVIAALEKSEARPVAGGVTIPAAEAAEEGTEDYQREAAELARATGAAENDYTTDEPSDSDGIMQMAALDTEAKPVMRSVDFGDAFDQPKGKEARAEPVNGEHTGSLPGKGKRPQKADAEADAATRDTIRTEPKLTKQIISQWALSKARFEVISKPVKAPRFVSRTMRAQPTSVYATGFTAATAEIDPGRFSGSAVNFMEVRKFNTQN